MKKKIYTIVDIETTGGRARQHKITEIAIVRHDGERVLDSYETLLNPEMPIPYNITRLTGINNEMVQNAPKFYEVAKEIVQRTEGAIFVAHNVRFDYSFIREEFARLGYTFSRKQLCTVRLSRKAFPGLPSYSLGNLIKHFGIKVNDRHRAMADTMATVTLFEKILAAEQQKTTIFDFINLGIKEALLPKNISLERLHALPETCGVYYLHDQDGTVIYVGKSKNIKKRVTEHFSKITEKASKLQRLVDDISYEETGSELVALLYESHLIKELRPTINRAQRHRYFPYMIHSYLDENGYRCFDVTKNTAATRKKYDVVSEYPTLSKAKSAILRVLRRFELCPYYCNIETQGRPCFNYHIQQCAGACIEAEPADVYNERADEAALVLNTVFEEDFFILDEGRHSDEKAVILVEGGTYQGFGYIHTDDLTGNITVLRDAILSYPSYPESSRIIQRFLNDNAGVKVVSFSQ